MMRSLDPASVAAAAGVQLRMNLPWLAWPVSIITLVYLVIAVRGSALGTIDSSVWESVGYTLPFLALLVGILAATTLPVLVAHGLSRRAVAVAGITVAVGLAVAGALLMQVGLVIERAAFRSAGVSYVLDDPHLYSEAVEPHLVLVEYTVTFAAFLATGWLITAGYYRFGNRGGTLAIPLAAVPAVGVVVALAGGWVGEVVAGAPGWIGDFGRPLAIGLALVVAAAGLAAMPALARSVPVRKP